MATIFYFSSRTANESSQQSGGILAFLIKLFGDNFFTDFIIRKSAHCIEFAGLCFLLNWAFLYTVGKLCIPCSFCITALYAVTDEIHQRFVEGRSCELRDWVIDCFGALLGIIAFLLLKKIIASLNKKRKKEEK